MGLFGSVHRREVVGVLTIDILFYTYNFKFQSIDGYILVIILELFQISFPSPPNPSILEESRN